MYFNILFSLNFSQLFEYQNQIFKKSKDYYYFMHIHGKTFLFQNHIEIGGMWWLDMMILEVFPNLWFYD